MKLKYYMRGLGIGIIVTTVVLSFANKKVKLSDAEIISQARELGMVMKEEETDDNLKQVLEKSLDKELDVKDAEDNTSDDIIKDDIIGKSNNQYNEVGDVTDEDVRDDKDIEDYVVTGEDVLIEGVADEGTTDEATRVEGIADEGATVEVSTDKDTVVTFTIVRGMSSRQVSELLKEKGLVEDAVNFDNYIKRKGKAGVIRIGTYTLPKDAEYEMILDAIVG